ncbi:MAG: NADH-quinone oxidoreductase subunit NuoB [Acidilobaceae archaeon]|nr:NADH-quinone oxidoreductase subunit NuoB [Acidilobaceae archaeon]MCX8165787.1 NADH-quinone oxidoreductase subunit NuoB [Acidilobaceae archaeon]MDW7974212.1 NADH-quinone oxidoreductase subunit NuoB [Sulfolobales archaeon]
MGVGVGGACAKGEGKVYAGNLNVAAKRARDIILGKLKLGEVVDWATTFSLWPVHLVTSCCGAEFAATWSPRFDAEQYGALPWISPRQTNFIIIEGTVTRKMACALRITYEQMAHPKFVIAMGACALDGGLFYNSYNVVKPWEIVPVDVYIAGCPPPPEALARAILDLRKKIREKKMASNWLREGWRGDVEYPMPKEDPCKWWQP